MTDTTTPAAPEPPQAPHDGAGHVWGKWYPQDRRTKYRQCLRDGCPVTEDDDVSRV